MKTLFPYLTFLSFLSLCFLLPQAFTHSNPSHTCIHDEVAYSQDFLDIPTNNSTEQRMLLDYQNIRIHLDFSLLTDVSEEFQKHIIDVILPPAKNYFEAALKVKPWTVNLTLKSMTKTCGDSITVPEQYTTEGVAADLLIFVATTTDTTNQFVATAGSCMLDMATMRPILGKITFNLAQIIPTTNKASIERTIGVTLHEMTHILGFSASLYQFYIDPLTNKLLGKNTMSKMVNGKQIDVLTTEPLRTRVRNHFDCPTLEGAYLENQGRIGSVGSHFEKRVFYNEYMTASTVLDYRITEFTLALLEGSGWYKVDYNMAEAITWGKGKGCSFLDTPCVDPETKMPITREFCSGLTKMGCSWTRRGAASCGNSKIQTYSDLPSYLDYWGNKTVMTDQFSDNCPIYNIYPILDCENETNIEEATLPDQEFYGEGGKCFLGNLSPKGKVIKSYGYCFKSSCELQGNGNYYVKVMVGDLEVTCTAQGDVSIEGLEGKLTCPDPTRFCNQYVNEGYCERKCMGRGTCINKKCECQDGWGHNDCSRKHYTDHCSRCQDGDLYKTSCHGDTCGCNPCNSTCTEYWKNIGEMEDAVCVNTDDYLRNSRDGNIKKDLESKKVINIKDYKVIIGIAVTGLTIIGLTLFFLHRYRKRKAQKQAATTTADPPEQRPESRKVTIKDIPTIITNPSPNMSKSKYEIIGKQEENKLDLHVAVEPDIRRKSKKLTILKETLKELPEFVRNMGKSPTKYEAMEEDKGFGNMVRSESRKSTVKDEQEEVYLDFNKEIEPIPSESESNQSQFEATQDEVKEKEI